ncbi:MAG TPA: YbaB/EbfC family nucleoid-associated protein [Rectinemataceae bacterium]|nr:YbaB/EbfC family nucleoid-associated protein [Rectinemataceae bacterium]
MNLSDMMEMLRNPQAMQARMNEFRERTARIEATGSSGGGMVRISLNGSLDMLSCVISPEAVEAGDIPLLQDLVRAAYNDAAGKVKESIQRELTSGVDGMPFPPGMLGGLG